MNDAPRLHGLLFGSAERYPDRAAFLQDDRSTPYGELASRAARLASSLRRLGVTRGARVALVLDGNVDYVIANYGVLAAGAVAVPTCPDAPPAALARTLAHCGAQAVIIEGRNLGHLAGQRERLPSLRAVIVLGPAEPLASGDLDVVPFDSLIEGPDELRDEGAAGPDLATIHYTSGTTGAPKGVMLSHSNIVANVRAVVRSLELTSTDVVGMVLPFFYAYGSSVLHTHLCAGGAVAMLGSIAFPARAMERLVRQRCTGLSGVPATFARILSYTGLASHDLSSLRYVTQAGAAMSPAMILKLRAAVPHARLWVMYGQTEATARLAHLPPEHLDRKLGSAGVAIPGVSLRVCDEAGMELPRGVIGEIVARGPSVSSGYWRAPEETARVFRPEGLRTGDLGWMDAEGFLYIEGRVSEMIKTGGHRVAPGEIEEVVASLDSVAECAAVGVPNDLLGEAITVFIVPKPDHAPPTLADVQRACSAELPRFKLPTHIRLVPSLPHTANGKIQRMALRAPLRTQREQTDV